MMVIKVLSLLFTIIFSVLISASGNGQGEFQTAHQMITQTYYYDGCHDFSKCKSGVLEAIGMLNDIIKNGKTDIDTYKLLADGYSKLAAAYSDKGSEEQLLYITKSNEIYDIVIPPINNRGFK